MVNVSVSICWGFSKDNKNKSFSKSKGAPALLLLEPTHLACPPLPCSPQALPGRTSSQGEQLVLQDVPGVSAFIH